MNKKLGDNFDQLKVFSQFYVTFDHLIEFPTELAECISENNSAVTFLLTSKMNCLLTLLLVQRTEAQKVPVWQAFITITTMVGTYFKNSVC